MPTIPFARDQLYTEVSPLNSLEVIMIKRLLLTAFLALFLIVALFVATSASSAASTSVLISAVYFDTYISNQPDEAFRLTNLSNSPVDLTNWKVTDGEGTATLRGSLNTGSSIWIAKTAVSFTLSFGYPPDDEYGGDSDPAVPDLALTGNLQLADGGDQLMLKNSTGSIVDSVVWESGAITDTGWIGEPVQHNYLGSTKGQVFYRKLDQITGRPVPDTDTFHDWAQAIDDDVNGRKVLRPGWDLDRYFQTAKFTQTAVVTYLIAPDNIFANVRQAISAAQTSIRYEGYTFDNADLGLAFAARAQAGVSVTVLLEGGPVGGIGNQDRWVCEQIEIAGGQCWFMVTDDQATPPIHSRYAYQHAKFMIVDDQWLLTGSENLNYSSMPADDKSDGTSGNRGIWLWTTAPGPLAHLRDVFQHDFDPAHHRDLKRWTASDPRYGAPPPTFTVSFESGGTAYTVQFTQPIVLSGTFNFEMVQSPDNSLRNTDSLLGMIGRANAFDFVLVEQLYEHKYWGPTNSTPTTDPNPRLEAFIAAARRGATVYLLLDSLYNDPTDSRGGNTATCDYVNSIAATEHLQLVCLLGNPTGTGIHNKMVLVSSANDAWVHTGSINGSENSSKLNREVAVQVHSRAAFDDLSQVFWYDWFDSGGPPPPPPPKRIYLPLVMR